MTLSRLTLGSMACSAAIAGLMLYYASTLDCTGPDCERDSLAAICVPLLFVLQLLVLAPLALHDAWLRKGDALRARAAAAVLAVLPIVASALAFSYARALWDGIKRYAG